MNILVILCILVLFVLRDIPDMDAWKKVKEILDEQGKAFAEFRKANDERLAEMAKKGTADPLLVEKVDKINKRLEELDEMKTSIEDIAKKAGRPGAMAGGADQNSVDMLNHKTGFLNFVRKGLDAGLRELEMKAMNMTAPADGGFALPVEMDKEILSLMRAASIMRQICSVVTLGTSDYRKLVSKHGATVGWVGETDTRPETGTPSLAQVTPYMGELYALPMATQQALDDPFFNVEEFLRMEIADDFAVEEETAFVTGNGTKKPKGFLAYDTATTADGTRAFGTLQYRATGSAGAFRSLSTSPVANPADDIISLIGDLKEKMLPGAIFLARRSIYTAIRLFKDAQANYIWQPSLQAGQPNTLLGYPAMSTEAMPAMASGAYVLAFGNFKRGYKIVDRIGIRILRDPYTNKPYVGFYTTKRVGGMVEDSEAIKLLKAAAS